MCQPGLSEGPTISPEGFAAELITHGLTEDEEKMETQRPGHGVRAKLAREANFPMEIAEAGGPGVDSGGAQRWVVGLVCFHLFHCQAWECRLRSPRSGQSGRINADKHQN